MSETTNNVTPEFNWDGMDKPEKLQNKALAHLILQALEAYRKRK